MRQEHLLARAVPGADLVGLVLSCSSAPASSATRPWARSASASCSSASSRSSSASGPAPADPRGRPRPLVDGVVRLQRGPAQAGLVIVAPISDGPRVRPRQARRPPLIAIGFAGMAFALRRGRGRRPRRDRADRRAGVPRCSRSTWQRVAILACARLRRDRLRRHLRAGRRRPRVLGGLPLRQPLHGRPTTTASHPEAGAGRPPADGADVFNMIYGTVDVPILGSSRDTDVGWYSLA